jgi:tripartite-type tricarboxylate transporter receptor subunit TctC
MLIGRTPQAIAAHPDRPYKTFAEAVDDARKRPGKVSMGVLGASQALVLMTLIKRENDVDLNLIPYKGGGPLNQDILAGVTDIAIGSTTSLSPHSAPARSGRSASRARSARRRCPTHRRSSSRASRAFRPTRGGASTRPPARRGRSSIA